ncbi:MAG TPA: hypothetical protein VL727_27035 [Puia sp.]|nr:hypothetical protein [Puia sp.]
MNTTVSLHRLVSELVESLLPLTVKRHSLVLNEVPRDLYIGADENMLAYVLWSLINGAIQSTHNECIHIEGISMDDCMMIRIKDVGTYFRHAISSDYRQVQHVAERLGGSISFENGRNAAFCISNSQLAA